MHYLYSYYDIITVSIFTFYSEQIEFVLGMHKKSLEAAKTFTDVDEQSSDDGKSTKDRDEIRSESIAALRAKAMEHSAKITYEHSEFDDKKSDNEQIDNYSSRFEEPGKDSLGESSQEEIDVE